MEVSARLNHFTFDMSSTVFSLRIDVISLDGSRLWQADRQEGHNQEAAFDGSETSALVYVPYVHYLETSQVTETIPEQRLIGRPSKDGEEWAKGKGPALVDLRIEEMSEGRLQVEGQWMRWFYPLKRRGKENGRSR